MLLQRFVGGRGLLISRQARCISKHLYTSRSVLVHSTAVVEAPTRTAAPAVAPAFKANLDFKFVRDNVQLLTENCKNRLSSANPALVAQLYDEYLQIKYECDSLRTSRNQNSQAMKGKLEPAVRQQLIEKGQQLKQQLEQLESQLAQVEAALQVEGQRLPNLTHPDVPIGGEENAAVLDLVGKQRQFDFEPRDHVAIGEALDLVDFEAAAEVSGSKFYYLRNAAALLELALVNWAMSKAVSRGFTPIMTPDLVKEAVLEKCGFQPRADNTQVYSVQDSNLCLTGTAEVPLGGVYMDKILAEKDLPIKMAAYGHCFRTEAGAAGAAGRGLYRVHQFSKVEMFVVCTPEQSEALHQELIDIERQLFTDLGLHFKVLDMPSGDLGAPAYRKYDIEAWMPGLQRYGEISSASNCTDYQARRLNIRYRPAPASSSSSGSSSGGSSDGSSTDSTARGGAASTSGNGSSGGKGGKGTKKGGSGSATAFAHTLNATACAVPRMIVAILENYQQADGSVVVPEVLRPYMGGLKVIRKPQ